MSQNAVPFADTLHSRNQTAARLAAWFRLFLKVFNYFISTCKALAISKFVCMQY